MVNSSYIYLVLYYYAINLSIADLLLNYNSISIPSPVLGQHCFTMVCYAHLLCCTGRITCEIRRFICFFCAFAATCGIFHTACHTYRLLFPMETGQPVLSPSGPDRTHPDYRLHAVSHHQHFIFPELCLPCYHKTLGRPDAIHSKCFFKADMECLSD